MPAGSNQIQFVDIAPRSKLRYTSNNNFTGRKYFPQPMCGGVAILDFDNDGRQDIFFTNGSKLPELKKTDSSFYNCLLKNSGDGTFEDVTEMAGLSGAHLDFCFGVAAGDYDNDGWTDLFICNAGPNALFRNNRDGTFSEVTREAGLNDKPRDLLSVCAAWVDYDRDGLLDLVVSQYTFWNPLTDPRCSINNDGVVDYYCHPKTVAAVPHTLYRNAGGKFVDVSQRAGFASAKGKGMGIGIADFNRDGAPDIFIANDTVRNFLFLNLRDGTFEEVGLLYGVAYNESAAMVSGMGCDVKDYNNDGWVDIFYSNLMTQVHALFRNEEGKFFSYLSPSSQVEALSRRFSGWSNAFMDYDNDGLKDIYSSNGDVDYLHRTSPQHDTMLHNLNGAIFEDVSGELGNDFLRAGYQRGSAVADLNGDGFQDLVVTSLNQTPRILMNSGNTNHWLMVDLTGSRGNRDAIGAEVSVTTASGRLLHNHVTTSVGFMSSSDRRVHFGLGSETAIESVEIKWPSGTVQRVKPVSVDRVLKVEEPK
jgi:enediyne biosynthesis protein E4